MGDKDLRLPVTFVENWNRSAGDHVIDPDEYAYLKKVAAQSPEETDDEFMALLDSVRDSSGHFPFGEISKYAKESVLETAGLDVYLSKGEDDSCQISMNKETPVGTSNGVKCTTYRYNIGGIAGIGVGYYRAPMIVDGEKRDAQLNGGHLDLELTHKSTWLPLIYPSLRVQADLGFAKNQGMLSAGVGPVLHLGWPNAFQIYGGMLANGHMGYIDNKIDDKARVGYSLTGLVGAQAWIGYAELGETALGTDILRPGRTFTVGLRFGM